MFGTRKWLRKEIFFKENGFLIFDFIMEYAKENQI